MGLEGVVVALAALLLLTYVVPQMIKKRGVLADTPVDERYSEDLRLISGRGLHQTPGEHGTVFFTERKMATDQSAPTSGNATPNRMRQVARERSRASARIAQRAAYHQRALVAAFSVVLLAVALWVFTAVGPVPVWLSIAVSALGGGYLVFFGWLVGTWNSLNNDDAEVIARSDRILAARASKREGLQRAIHAGRGVARAEDAQVETAQSSDRVAGDGVGVEARATGAPAANEGAEDSAVDRDARTETEAAGALDDGGTGSNTRTERSRAAEVQAPATESRSREDRTTSSRPGMPRQSMEWQSSSRRDVSAPRAASRGELDTPSYTLKPTISKRSVKPYEAPEQPEADVPFRPTKLGQQLGEEVLETPNAAPEMTGNEELARDVLGGGATLDALLDRRRA